MVPSACGCPRICLLLCAIGQSHCTAQSVAEANASAGAAAWCEVDSACSGDESGSESCSCRPSRRACSQEAELQVHGAHRHPHLSHLSSLSLCFTHHPSHSSSWSSRWLSLPLRRSSAHAHRSRGSFPSTSAAISLAKACGGGCSTFTRARCSCGSSSSGLRATGHNRDVVHGTCGGRGASGDS